MTLFYAPIRRDSVALLRFPFLSHVQIFSCKISFVCHLKCTYNSFSSHFCFLVIVVVLILVFVSCSCNKPLFALFYVVFESSYRYIYAIFNDGVCVHFLLLFLTQYTCMLSWPGIFQFGIFFFFLCYSEWITVYFSLGPFSTPSNSFCLLVILSASGKIQVFVNLFTFFYFHSVVHWNSKIHHISFLLVRSSGWNYMTCLHLKIPMNSLRHFLGKFWFVQIPSVNMAKF